jgi:hypothetical protein
VVPPTTEADDTEADAPVDDAEADAESETVDEAGDGEALGDDAPSVPRRNASRGRWLLVAGALAIVFGLIASVMTASYLRLRSDKQSSEQDRTAVATTAARLAEAMTAIDAGGDNQAEADVVHQLGTGPLIEQYDRVIPDTRKLLTALKVKSENGQITPNGVYVGDIEGDQAQVIVVIDLVIVGEVTKVVPNQYLRMHLVKLNGEWKVDNVSDVNTALGAPAGGTAPTTTAPATPSTASSSG